MIPIELVEEYNLQEAIPDDVLEMYWKEAHEDIGHGDDRHLNRRILLLTYAYQKLGEAIKERIAELAKVTA